MSTRFVNYFAYKSGTGNRFLPLATEGFAPPSGAPTRRLLYVGFSAVVTQAGHEEASAAHAKAVPNSDPLELKDHLALRLRLPGRSAAFDPHRTLYPGGKTRRLLDDSYIAWLLHPENRRSAVLVSYGPSHVYFWRALREDLVIARASAPPGSDERALYEAARNLDLSANSGVTNEDVYKFMTVELIHEPIRRSGLYTSVDSLSVLQYLNQGTCRPMWRINGPHPSLAALEAERQSDIVNMKHKARHSKGIWQETAFGAFLRLYFNGLLRLQGERSLRALVDDGRTTWADLAAVTWNPILVETAAYYFCLDIGLLDGRAPSVLLPDVGVGKGIDVLDIRARLRDRSPRTEATILARLEHVTEGSLDEVASVLRSTGALELQCKAGDKSLDDRASHLLYFGPRPQQKVRTAPARVYTSDLTSMVLASPNEWPHLSAFIAMQAENLTLAG